MTKLVTASEIRSLAKQLQADAIAVNDLEKELNVPALKGAYVNIGTVVATLNSLADHTQQED